MLANSFVFKHMTNTVGGTSDMGVTGTLEAPIRFRLTADGTKQYIHRLNLTLLDSTIAWAKFGGIAALTNGMTVKAHDVDDSVLLDFLDGHTIKDNAHWGELAGVDASKSPGNDYFSVRWTLRNAGQPFHLTKGQYLEMLVQDDLDPIDSFSIMTQGYYAPK